jgi:hypothetical protein
MAPPAANEADGGGGVTAAALPKGREEFGNPGGRRGAVREGDLGRRLEGRAPGREAVGLLDDGEHLSLLVFFVVEFGREGEGHGVVVFAHADV